MWLGRMDRGLCQGILCSLCLLIFAAGTAQARFLNAKQARRRPRARIACVASATAGTRYPNPSALGGHSYENPGLWERNGIVYTCRAGLVDITHVRKMTDWTAFLAYRLRETILASRMDFSFRMLEPSVCHVRIEYPEDWGLLPASVRHETAIEVSSELGSYLASTVGTWHEILTWFGYKAAGFYPEYVSSFSWEDCYSNAIGSRMGVTALRDPNHEFNRAVTTLLKRELARLEVQPEPAAWLAGKTVHGTWWTGNYCWYHMVKRNFNIGLDDGWITPWLVPGMSGCDGSQPEECPVPTLAFLQRHGLAITFEIEPREWERAKILALVYPQRLQRAHRGGPLFRPDLGVHPGPGGQTLRTQRGRSRSEDHESATAERPRFVRPGRPLARGRHVVRSARDGTEAPRADEFSRATPIKSMAS